MRLAINTSNLTFRKLKITDYHQFSKLFYSCFKKKISIKFFKWRYFNNKFSFCYGAFKESILISNVGMISIKLNNNKNERIFSRHTSMVLKKFRGKGIFSMLLEKVKNKISKEVRLVAMWPNKNNFANFGIDKRKILNEKYYIYKTHSKKSFLKKTKNYHINNLIKLKKFIKNDNSFFLKNYVYFKNRYLSYQKNQYIINKFNIKKDTSFFILKVNKNNLDFNYVILDHFGSDKIKSKHLSSLILDHDQLIHLSKKKINKSNFRLLNYLNFKLGIIKGYNTKQKNLILANKEISLGDTDIFMTIGKKHNKI